MASTDTLLPSEMSLGPKGTHEGGKVSASLCHMKLMKALSQVDLGQDPTIRHPGQNFLYVSHVAMLLYGHLIELAVIHTQLHFT